MFPTTRRYAVWLLLALLAPLALACGGEPGSSEQEEVDRALELAMAEDSAAELEDVAIAQPEEAPEESAPAEATPPRTEQPRRPAPAPRRAPAAAPQPEPAPQPAPAAPRYETLSVPAGTSFEITLDQELSTRNNRAGDVFTATLTRPLTDGRTVIVPVGARVRGEVTASQASGGSGQPAILKLAFDEISFDGETYPIALTITEVHPTSKGRLSTGGKAARIGGGAAAGAILGRIIGGDAKGAVIGGVVGAAAGTAITMGTNDVDAVLESGSVMGVRLDEPLEIRREVQ